MPSNQKRSTEQARFVYPLLGKAFGKELKIIEEQGKDQVGASNLESILLDMKKLKSIENFISHRLPKWLDYK